MKNFLDDVLGSFTERGKFCIEFTEKNLSLALEYFCWTVLFCCNGQRNGQKFMRAFKYRVFIKYCVFFEDFKIYSGLWPLSVSPRCQ